MSTSRVEVAPGRPKVSPLYDPRVRSVVFQLVLCLFVAFLVWEAASNAIENLRRQNIATGLGFWDNVAGFPISQTLIAYSERYSTYGQAFWVGLINTLLVAVIGIVLATILGFTMGVARLSKNILVAGVARWYVEIVRNLPLLLQLLFWYNAVLKALADRARQRPAALRRPSSTIAACSCREPLPEPASTSSGGARRRRRRRDRLPASGPASARSRPASRPRWAG